MVFDAEGRRLNANLRSSCNNLRTDAVDDAQDPCDGPDRQRTRWAQAGRRGLCRQADYSRLLGLDDTGTLLRLRTLRCELVDPAISEHGGRLVSTAGDSLFMEFDSIDGAVRCAVMFQERVPDFDGDHPPEQVIRFRVGINLADVIADGMNLHGDGVNVAARLQAECPPGGVCVSRAVRDHVHGGLNLTFAELGALSLKNIARPVEAFLWRPEATRLVVTPPSPTAIAGPATSPSKRPRLSVAVASLRNLGDPNEHEYLVDGLAEDISTDLSQYLGSALVALPDLLRRNPASAGPRDIAHQAGIEYLVQGSIRRIADRLVVSLEMTDVETDVHLCRERFEIDLGGTVDVRNEIVGRVAYTLHIKLVEELNRHIEAQPQKDRSANALVIRGVFLFIRSIAFGRFRAGLEEGGQCFETALAKAPTSIGARLGLATALTWEAMEGWSRHGTENEVRAEHLLLDVLAAEPRQAYAHTTMGYLRRHQGHLNDALIEFRLALELNPNHFITIAQLGLTLIELGQPEPAIPLIEKSLRLSPHGTHAAAHHGYLGLSKLLLGQIEPAVMSLRTARALTPRIPFIHWWLGAALGLKGELDEAVPEMQQAIEMGPDVISGFPNLRRADSSVSALFEKTVYAGLKQAALRTNDIHFPEFDAIRYIPASARAVNRSRPPSTARPSIILTDGQTPRPDLSNDHSDRGDANPIHRAPRQHIHSPIRPTVPAQAVPKP